MCIRCVVYFIYLKIYSVYSIIRLYLRLYIFLKILGIRGCV